MHLWKLLQLGCQCIASDIGGVKPLVKANSNGILFEQENFMDLAEKLRSILDNPDSAKILGENARRDMVEGFSFEKIAHDYSKLYCLLLNPE